MARNKKYETKWFKTEKEAVEFADSQNASMPVDPKTNEKPVGYKVYACKHPGHEKGEPFFIAALSPGNATIEAGLKVGLSVQRANYTPTMAPADYLSKISEDSIKQLEELLKKRKANAAAAK